jgi:exodeoxyribonuclease VII large subunit
LSSDIQDWLIIPIDSSDFKSPALYSAVVTPSPNPQQQPALRDQSQLGFSFESAAASLSRHIWKVGDLVSEVRLHVEREYGDLWVEGEISNLRPAPSGHVYFTLKDGDAQLPVVLFRKQASLLRFRPTDGLHVLLRGKISIYEQRGQMQLVAEFLEPVGAGSLQLAFEQLKQRLEARGFFDPDRKKPLPAFPHCVGIVTSPTGAVIRDFVNIVSRRHAGLHVLLYPALVQGEAAAAEVAAGIAWFNRSRTVDLIVIARGGGSLEDLAPFNSEFLAESIFNSELPVISAIGHETDFTIADFVADLRAPTPSAAAELVTSALHNIADRVYTLDQRLLRAARYRLMQASNALARVRVESILVRERDQLRRRQQRVDDLSLRMESHWRARHRRLAEKLHQLSTRLLRHDVVARTHMARERFAALEDRITRAERDHLRTLREREAALTRHLTALSPLAVLSRGYALVYDDRGLLVKDTENITEGQSIVTRLARGRVRSRVTQVEKETRSS